MSQRYKGGVISATPPTTSTSSASGVWTEQQFMQGVASGNWPALAGAPTIGTATAGALSASVAFTAPAYTGSGITGYTATSSPGGITGTGASSPITVSGLTAGTAYTFTVTATTAAGQGPASAASNSVTPTLPQYIEDVFSTYLYSGTNALQTITNGIDLSGSGGLVWSKGRNNPGYNHTLMSTAYSGMLFSDTTQGANDYPTDINSYNSNGFTLKASTNYANISGTNYASWTFREQPKFFDVVTYTGNGADNRNIAHSLGVTAACIIVKRTDSTSNWSVYHQGNINGSGSGQNTYSLNTTGAANNLFTVDRSSSTNFTVSDAGAGADSCNVNGGTYVAYLFASNAGGFGLTGTDNVNSCGNFVSDGSGNATVTLGYEPQWLLTKQSSGAGGQQWYVVDTMRPWSTDTSTDVALKPNTSQAESAGNYGTPTATGFTQTGLNASATHIYVAIRRGPMKTPTVGTSVLASVTRSGTGSTAIITGASSPPDLVIVKSRSNATEFAFTDRLRSVTKELSSSYTFSEADFGTNPTVSINMNGWTAPAGYGSFNQSGYTYVDYLFSRYPNVFDEVCYTGDYAANPQVPHNLGVAPEMLIARSRVSAGQWYIKHIGMSDTQEIYFNSNAASAGPTWVRTSTYWQYSSAQYPNDAHVAYLFATLAGISKVGSYTGTGASQVINCGFTTGARWVLIKRTDSTGDWYVWDTARGMVSGTDPYMIMNDALAETNANYVFTSSTGFTIQSGVPAGINANGGNFIFLAIA